MMRVYLLSLLLRLASVTWEKLQLLETRNETTAVTLCSRSECLDTRCLRRMQRPAYRAIRLAK